MCDPVTLTLASTGMSYAGGAMAASSYGAIASAGVGMVNAASYINASSSIYKASSAITSVMSSPIATIGMSLLGGRQEARAYDYEAQRAEYQSKAYKREAEMREVEALQKQNALKAKYLRERSSNKALLASRGITVASASYKALMEENYNNFMSTSNNMRMVDMDQMLASKENAYISGLESKVQRKAQKQTGITSLIKGVQTASKIYGESGSLFNTG